MTTTTIYNGTIRKRSDGRWEYAYKDTEGKRCFISAQSKAELHNKLDLAFAVPDPVTPPPEVTPPPQLLIKDWMPLWFSNYVTAGKSTRQRYEIDIRLHIIPSIGDIDVAELTSLQLQQMFKQLLSKGLSPKSVKNIHGVMHSALAIAVKLGYTPRNVTEDCSLPKVQKKEMKTLADAKLTTFLEAAQSDEFYEAFFVCIFTGMRESELLGLTWDCIDMEHGIIRIYRQFRRQNYHNEPSEWKFSPLKNRKERTIKVPAQVISMLQQVREKQQERRRICGSAWKNNQDFVFTKKDGAFIQTSQLYRHFKRIVTSMGLPDVRFHDLRHTYATLAIQSGTDLKTVSTNLGHATVAFTMDQYGHVSEKMKEKSAKLMENLIANLPSEAIEKHPFAAKMRQK